MTDQINWGIIGCGNVTEVKSGPAFNKVPHSKLVAVMRRDAAKAADYAARHNVPKWYSDAHQLINDPEVNAIYIATPPSSHKQYTLASLAAGKPVYVEKPMALNEAECAEMEAASVATNTKLCIAHYRRELPVFKQIKSLLNDKVIGDVRFVDMRLFQSPAKNMIAQADENWRLNPAISGGGLFHDLAPHQLDLMYHFFGPALKVEGFARNPANAAAADDIVSGQMVFNNGVLFNGLWCFAVAEQEVKDTCEIVGSLGKISFSIFAGNIEVSVNGNIEHYSFPYPPHVQQPMIEKVVQYFLGHGLNPCAAAEAIIVMQWMDKMTRVK